MVARTRPINDRKLLLSAILLFVVGIISFCEKPWALRRASINRLVAMSSLMKGERRSPSGWWQWCLTELDDRYKCWKPMPEGTAPILSQGDKVQMMLSDLSLYAAKVTLETRKKGADQEVLEPLTVGEDKMKPWLRQAFGLIYTRANVIFTPAYLACHVLLVPSMYIAAIMLFATSHKEDYHGIDVKMTYLLLCFTSVLDVFGLLISETMYWVMSSKAKVPALCENLPGYNLIDSVLRTMRPSTGSLLKLAKRLGYKEGYFRRQKDTASTYGSVSEFITAELVSISGKVENADFSSYRSFTKDYWALRPVLRDECFRRPEIRRSLRRASMGRIAGEAAKLASDPYGSYTLVHDACKLAEELVGMEEETRWHLMYRVWVGMLCYSASMCRGYLHAKSLGEGGEFLSYVWLVVSLKGTKTLADKLQMPEPEEAEEQRMETTKAAPTTMNGKPSASSATLEETGAERLDRIFG